MVTEVDLTARRRRRTGGLGIVPSVEDRDDSVPGLTQQRFLVDALDESSWPALLPLWVLLAAGWLMLSRGPETAWAPALLAAVVGLMAAGGLSGRSGWWWVWLPLTALVVSGAFVVEFWLINTAYPASDLRWLPFRAGSAPRWQYFATVLGVGIAASVVRPRVPGVGIVRAGFVSLVAVAYLFHGPFPDSRDGLGPGLVVLTLVLSTVGLVDHFAAWINRRRIVRGVAYALIAVAVTLGAAGVFWRIVLLPPLDPGFNIGPVEVDNVLPIATLGAVIVHAAILSMALVHRDRNQKASTSESMWLDRQYD